MRSAYFFAVTLVIAGLGFFSLIGQSEASPLGGIASISETKSGISSGSLVEKVMWGCSHGVKRMCAHRWGWGTWRYRRCLENQCGGHGGGWGHGHHCRKWHNICRNRWGHGWDFRRCMRNHGC